MHRSLIAFLALAICLPGSAAVADSNAPPDSYLTTTKKPAPKVKAAKKKPNFAARSRCNRVTIDWGDYVRCGYDYPPWAMGWESFQRARRKAATQ